VENGKKVELKVPANSGRFLDKIGITGKKNKKQGALSKWGRYTIKKKKTAKGPTCLEKSPGRGDRKGKVKQQDDRTWGVAFERGGKKNPRKSCFRLQKTT